MILTTRVVWTRASAVFLFLLAFGLVPMHSRPPSNSAGKSLVAKEKLIGEKSSATSPSDKEDTISPDRRRLAWRDKHRKKWTVMDNGEPVGGQYDKVEWIIYSPDSQHLAYRAKKKNKWVQVLDGVEYPGEYNKIGKARFSKDSQRLAYRAKTGKTWRMVVNGEAHSSYDKIGGPSFSPDSQRLAYTAKKGESWFIVLNGEEGAAFQSVGFPRFTPDNERLVHAAKREERWVLIDDGEEVGPEMKDGYRLLGFTSQSMKAISLGFQDSKVTVHVGTLTGPPFDVVNLPIKYNSDDDTPVYAAANAVIPTFKSNRIDGQVIVGNAAGQVYEGTGLGAGKLRRGIFVRGFRPHFFGVSTPVVSSDSKRVVYAARRDSNDYVVVLDGNEGPTYERIVCGPSFNDVDEVFYVGRKEQTLILVVEGKQKMRFEWKGVDTCSDILFTEDGDHFIYVAVQGGHLYETGLTARAKRRVFVDGQPGNSYNANAVGVLISYVSDDKVHVIYEVHDSKLNNAVSSFVVQDTVEGKHYDQIIFRSLDRTENNRMTYVAREGRRFYRVTQWLAESSSEPDE